MLPHRHSHAHLEVRELRERAVPIAQIACVPANEPQLKRREHVLDPRGAGIVAAGGLGVRDLDEAPLSRRRVHERLRGAGLPRRGHRAPSRLAPARDDEPAARPRAAGKIAPPAQVGEQPFLNVHLNQRFEVS